MNKETRIFIWDLILLFLCIYDVRYMSGNIRADFFWTPFIAAVISGLFAMFFVHKINKSLR